MISWGHSPLGRREAIRQVRRLRLQAFEALGSRRYSRPALYDLDVKLAPYLPDRPGTFVEVGANDGYTQSNTYYLERWRGWRGVLVEPFPHLHRACVRVRPRSQCFNCALVAPEEDGAAVRMRYADLMSLAAGSRGDDLAEGEHIAAGEKSNHVRTFELTVPGRTLSAVLDEAGVGELDLMVVDTEGSEGAVLRGASLDRHRPTLLLVEMNDATVEQVVSPWYEPVAELTFHDVLFRRRA